MSQEQIILNFAFMCKYYEIRTYLKQNNTMIVPYNKDVPCLYITNQNPTACYLVTTQLIKGQVGWKHKPNPFIKESLLAMVKCK